MTMGVVCVVFITNLPKTKTQTNVYVKSMRVRDLEPVEPEPVEPEPVEPEPVEPVEPEQMLEKTLVSDPESAPEPEPVLAPPEPAPETEPPEPPRARVFLDNEKPDRPHKWLVFTSAGDQSNVQQWYRDDKDFDIMVVYYGSGTYEYEHLVDRFETRKDGKFANLLHYYNTLNYSSIAVFDDDIEISSQDLSKLFCFQEKYDVGIASPTFKPYHNGYLSLMPVQNSEIRFVDFVEMNTPLFRQDVLNQFMIVFDPIIKGWGTDIWFSHLCTKSNYCDIALADKIHAHNPPKRKNGKREIESLQPEFKRAATWKKFAKEHGIPDSTGHAGVKGFDLSPRPRFFIYDDDDITMSKWSKICDTRNTADIDMINQAMNHHLRTLDPREAQLFIIPIPVYQSFKCDPEGHTLRIERAFSKLFRSKWFNNGKNHLMNGHHWRFSGWCADEHFLPTKIWNRIQEMVILTRYEVYNSSKWRAPEYVRNPVSLYNKNWERTKHSIITPYSEHQGVPLVTTMPSMSEWQAREIFIWYHTRKSGSVHGATILRKKPLEVTCNECSIGYDIPLDKWSHGWQNSRFCLVIRGDTPTTHAFYNAIRSFCIPVLISDGFEAVGLPFRTKLNLGAFSVRITEANFIDGGMDALIKRVNTLEKDTIRNKLLQLKAVQGDLIWDYPDGRVFNNIIEEIV
jgi:hypothetical protein